MLAFLLHPLSHPLFQDTHLILSLFKSIKPTLEECPISPDPLGMVRAPLRKRLEDLVLQCMHSLHMRGDEGCES